MPCCGREGGREGGLLLQYSSPSFERPPSNPTESGLPKRGGLPLEVRRWGNGWGQR